MKNFFLVLVLVINAFFAPAQSAYYSTATDYYTLLNNTFSDSSAYNTTAFVEQRWRLAGNAGYNESIFYVEKILKNAGYTKEINGEQDAVLTYRIEKRKMSKPTWEPVNASVIIEGETEPLLHFAVNRNMIAINSASTPIAGETAEVIDVGKGTRKDFEGKNVKGKIVFAETYIGSLYNLAVKNGAIGVLAYNMPAYTKPQKNIHSIQFQQIPYTDAASQKWGLLLSYHAKEKLKKALARGSVKVKVVIETKSYEAEELTLIANIRGAVKPQERFVFSAHVQEPGANDNATGVGTLSEIARTAATLVKQKKIAPGRTITFLWGDEIRSTNRYIRDDSVRAKGIKWGLSLDMVGEDVSKTGGSFLIEKMPDPSAIWTRGNDKHTEWGGSPLKEEDLFPHYFTDVLINSCKKQAVISGWTVNTNPFEGGSDHTPFLEAKIPGLLMWHFTDEFYHTDADRISNVSAREMKNVGVSALATALLLTTANEKNTLSLIDQLGYNAMVRLNNELALSISAIEKGTSVEEEKHIIEEWVDWYKKAIEKMKEINLAGATPKINTKINEVLKSIERKHISMIKVLETTK
ncbi:MAG TPA: M28 family peptidase [Chitinophagaceae bacterium]|nr:M28 family peptidase [Chitinophagaceae bacterium]